MIILFLNCGSSSVKYSVYDWEKKRSLAAGGVERIGLAGSFITHERPGQEAFEWRQDCKNHTDAINLVIRTLTDKEHGVVANVNMISAVGHRIVHGGKFTKSVVATQEVIDELKNIADLAPLHNPAHILGIEAAMSILPHVMHVCVMDTAFHQTMPAFAYMYALPRNWYTDYHMRRFGAHGSSALYCSRRAAVLLGKPVEDTNTIICHIGNGASCTAVKNGQCYDTSMGLTPLEGLIMGTRCGDIDPSICFHMMKKLNMAPDEMYRILNRESGVKAITGGRFADRRDIVENAQKGDELCKLAIAMESYRIKKYIGSYMAALGRVDAIVFTAGVGERSPFIRGKAVEGLENYGIVADEQKNRDAQTKNAESCISAANSKVKIFVVPTDEEIVGVQDIVALQAGTYDVYTKFRYIFEDKEYRNSLRDEAFAEEIKKKPFLLHAAVNLPENLKEKLK
ncbi:acetate/propionate family kinase [Candidatus Avelusimicrobium facis]|uniref:acetate kinase n=1 Tax=Candidatus Avelusimicrobium facis TaxID=3416203 RepID=UPI0015B3B0ED